MGTYNGIEYEEIGTRKRNSKGELMEVKSLWVIIRGAGHGKTRLIGFEKNIIDVQHERRESERADSMNKLQEIIESFERNYEPEYLDENLTILEAWEQVSWYGLEEEVKEVVWSKVELFPRIEKIYSVQLTEDQKLKINSYLEGYINEWENAPDELTDEQEKNLNRLLEITVEKICNLFD